MFCPKCGTQMQTLKTIPTRGVEHRWVQCLSARCRFKVTTKEVIVPNFEFRVLDAQRAQVRRQLAKVPPPPSPNEFRALKAKRVYNPRQLSRIPPPPPSPRAPSTRLSTTKRSR